MHLWRTGIHNKGVFDRLQLGGGGDLIMPNKEWAMFINYLINIHLLRFNILLIYPTV